MLFLTEFKGINYLYFSTMAEGYYYLVESTEFLIGRFSLLPIFLLSLNNNISALFRIQPLCH